MVAISSTNSTAIILILLYLPYQERLTSSPRDATSNSKTAFYLISFIARWALLKTIVKLLQPGPAKPLFPTPFSRYRAHIYLFVQKTHTHVVICKLRVIKTKFNLNLTLYTLCLCMFERARVQIGRPPCNVMLDGGDDGVVSVYNVQEEKLGKSITLCTVGKEVCCRNVRQGDFPNFPRNV